MILSIIVKQLYSFIIVAGEGKTGTTEIAKILGSLGMCVGHWDTTFNCSLTQHDRWLYAFNYIMDSKPEQYSRINYLNLLHGIDGVSDVPIPTVFPFLYHSMNHSFVILNTRNSYNWAHRRHQWTRHHDDPIPLQYPANHSIRDRYNLHMSTFNDTPVETGIYTYEAYNSYVRNTVPHDHLLEIDLFKHQNFPLQKTLVSFVKLTNSN